MIYIDYIGDKLKLYYYYYVKISNKITCFLFVLNIFLIVNKQTFYVVYMWFFKLIFIFYCIYIYIFIEKLCLLWNIKSNINYGGTFKPTGKMIRTKIDQNPKHK